MKRLRDLLLAFILAIMATAVVYWKIPVRGVVPFPGHLLVGRFFPFNTMNWEGYPAGVPYKEFINADVVRQLYPWRDIAIEQLKKGEIPWWNPYAFAGTPLLANIQSAPLYPLNLVYWLLDQRHAWIFQVLLQPILALTFMLLYARSLALAWPAALLAALAFAFGGYLTIFWQLNTVGHAALWLPLILWTIDAWLKTAKRRYLLILTLALTSSLLAGHLQTTAYVLIVTTAYGIFRVGFGLSEKGRALLPLGVALAAAVILASPQLLPAARLLGETPRGTQADEQIFKQFILPPKQLVTFLAHDYFGNPATENYWGEDYGEFMGFFGVAALVMVGMALTDLRDERTRFFAILGGLALLLALPPFALLIPLLRLPILATSAPARGLMIVQFCAAVLAGLGFDRWLRGKAHPKPALLTVTALYALIWAIAARGYWGASDPSALAKWWVTLRNLVLPSSVFIATSMIVLTAQPIRKRVRYLGKYIPSLLILVALVEYSYFANKFQTFSHWRFFFPDSPIYRFLSEHSRESPDRFFGDYTASIMSNSWVPYRAYGVEGYDALYLRRYGELLAASDTGKIPESIPRSDANLIANRDDSRRRRLQDLLGVRYILDKNDNPRGNWEPDPHRFPPDRYQLIWQEGKFKIYENTQALPRALLVPGYVVETDPQKIIDRIFDPNFDLTASVILEEEIPGILASDATTLKSQSEEATLRFVRYEPNTVELEVTTDTRQLLFLSDAYYPDWAAAIDGNETPIYRANYAFRAVVVPPGSHTVVMRYRPTWLPSDSKQGL